MNRQSKNDNLHGSKWLTSRGADGRTLALWFDLWHYQSLFEISGFSALSPAAVHANFMEKAAKVTKDRGSIFISTRSRSQNARNIWGRHFPFFFEKGNRLHKLDELEEMIKSIGSLTIESIKTFKYRRNASLDQLVTLARNYHYYTFSLYRNDEFESALKSFQKNIIRRFRPKPTSPEQLPLFSLPETTKPFCIPEAIERFDENILLVGQKGLA